MRPKLMKRLWQRDEPSYLPMGSDSQIVMQGAFGAVQALRS